jgi:perosamine synthetase
MSTLIPTELWSYSAGDVFRSFAAIKNSHAQDDSLALPGIGPAVTTRSARAAVVVAIKALGLAAGSRIGVPLYCCPVVFKAIKEAGCAPRFLDIDPATFCLSSEDLSAKRTDIDSVIAVHMFGNVCDMPRIMEMARGLPVIEDCAQSIGSRLDGRAIGTFGEISFFSFRSGKYLAVGEGGALYTRDKALDARISDLVAGLPAPTSAQETRHILETYVRSKLRSKPLWGLAGSRIWGLYNKKMEFADKSPIVLGKMFRSDRETTRRRMISLPALIARQRANAAYYEGHLRIDPARLCYEGPRAFYNRFMYPITFPSPGQRDLMAAYLRKHAIGTARPYEDVIAGAAAHYGYRGDCPAAERTLRSTLVVPVHAGIKTSEIRGITDRINRGWAEINAER